MIGLALLLWCLRKEVHPGVKIIVATATPNPNILNILSSNPKTVPQLKIGADRSHVLRYRRLADSQTKKGQGLSQEFMMEQVQVMIEAMHTYHKENGYFCNAMMLASGLEDVEFLYSQMEKALAREKLDKIFVLQPATSHVEYSEIKETHEKAEANDQYVVDICTNAMQNSITIKNLGILVDCGFRKCPVWDFYKVQSLQLCPASEADVEQAAGRLRRGADKRPGIAITYQDANMTREAHIESEFYSMPIHMFILKLIAGDLKPEHVLLRMDEIGHKHVGNNALLTLVELKELGALKISKEKGKSWELTRLGKDMAWINKDPKTSEFLAQVFHEHPDKPDLLYWAVMLACWMGFTSKPILVIPKIHLKDAAAIKEQNKAQESFVKMPGNDVAHKVMWTLQQAETFEDSKTGHQELRAWCRDNYVSCSALNMLLKEKWALMDDMLRHELKVNEYSEDPIEKHMPTLVPFLVKTFGICSRHPGKRDLYLLSGESSWKSDPRMGKIDRLETPLLNRGVMLPIWVLPVCIRRLAARDGHILTKVINLDPFKPQLTKQGLTPEFFYSQRIKGHEQDHESDDEEEEPQQFAQGDFEPEEPYPPLKEPQDKNAAKKATSPTFVPATPAPSPASAPIGSKWADVEDVEEEEEDKEEPNNKEDEEQEGDEGQEGDEKAQEEEPDPEDAEEEEDLLLLAGNRDGRRGRRD